VVSEAPAHLPFEGKAHMQPSTPSNQPDPPAVPTRSPRILIADDTPEAVELLEAYLAGTDCETAIATDGEETLARVADWHPDLILLDVMMPKISGFEVCKRLRSNSATRDIAILMVTALDQTSDVERAVEAGTDDFLSKPINKTELLLHVRNLLKSRQKKKELDRALDYFESMQRDNP
jgi:two-component system alkaline phosphatase synthesis response regulator PhoP